MNYCESTAIRHDGRVVCRHLTGDLPLLCDNDSTLVMYADLLRITNYTYVFIWSFDFFPSLSQCGGNYPFFKWPRTQLSRCVCVCMCLCVYMCMCICVCICVHVCICMYVCGTGYVYVCVAHVHVCVH